jgi:hypothetical protein
MRYQIFIVIGKENVENFADGMLENVEYDKVLQLKFETVDEKVAFCKGVQYTADYENYLFIDEEEYLEFQNL